MAKVKELGNVKVVHKSGIVETDKGFKSIIKAVKGDRLILDMQTKIVSIAPKKTARKSKAKEVVEVPEVEETETETTGTDEASGDE